jgi:hypothetical protein
MAPAKPYSHLPGMHFVIKEQKFNPSQLKKRLILLRIFLESIMHEYQIITKRFKKAREKNNKTK